MAAFNLEAYQKACDWSSIPAPYLEPKFEETIEAESFPGFVLPAWVDGDIRWYGVAHDQRHWRMLQPILLAYVGHTVTSFSGEPSQLDSKIPVEAYLASLHAYAIVRLDAPGNAKFASRALHRMKDSLFVRPKDLRPPPMSTAQMLANFDMCLVDGNRNGAVAWLSRLQSELRLDAINLSFTRVKLYATFRDWGSILSDIAFDEICRIRKPAIVAHHIFEAIWYQHLEPHSTDLSAIRATYEEECKQYISELLASSGVPSKWVAEKFSVLFEQFHEDDLTSNKIQLIDRDVTQHADVHEPGTAPEIDSEPFVSSLVEGAVFYSKEFIGEQDSATSTDTVTDWLSWLRKLEDRDFREFRQVAEDLALTFEVTEFEDPEDISDFVEALFDIETGRASARLDCALPILIKWQKKDPDYPRKEMAPLYEISLMRLIEASNRGGEFREAFSEMLMALLEVGLSDTSYRGLLDYVTKAVPSGAGTSDVFWLLDIAAVLCKFSATNESERKTVLNSILNSLEPVSRQMTSVQRCAYSNIASAAGWEPIAETDDPDEQLIADILKGKTVGIYTLTESAGRQAATVLKSLAPGVKVEVSSEKVCTTRLKKLSQNADIMVVTTASAKHAATDCIQQNREANRILYAAGRGCCSILRAVEEHVFELVQGAEPQPA